MMKEQQTYWTGQENLSSGFNAEKLVARKPYVACACGKGLQRVSA